MLGFSESDTWNTVLLAILGVISFFTNEIVTFIMLGFIIIVLTNIYNVLKDIYKKLDTTN